MKQEVRDQYEEIKAEFLDEVVQGEREWVCRGGKFRTREPNRSYGDGHCPVSARVGLSAAKAFPSAAAEHELDWHIALAVFIPLAADTTAEHGVDIPDGEGREVYEDFRNFLGELAHLSRLPAEERAEHAQQPEEVNAIQA